MTSWGQSPAGQSSAERGRVDSPAGQGVPKRKGGVLAASGGTGSSRTLSAAAVDSHCPKGLAAVCATCAEPSGPALLRVTQDWLLSLPAASSLCSH